MRVLVFDTEATHISNGQICQLSYLICDRPEIVGRNIYFTVDGMDEKSQEIHGLSYEMCVELSEGKHFEDFAEEIANDFKSVDTLVGHNIRFDMDILQKELDRTGIKAEFTKNQICTMNYFTPIMSLERKVGPRPKPPRLEELIDFFEISREMIAQRSIELFGGGEAAHDARWDTMATYLCLEKAEKLGHIRHVF